MPRGRPKGSKNKPKNIVPPEIVKEQAAPSPPSPVDPVETPKKKRGRPPKQLKEGKVIVTEVDNVPAEIDLEQSEFGYYPVNMNNFLFTEHRLYKTVAYLVSCMPPTTLKKYVDEAKRLGEDYRIYIIRKMLEFLGFKRDDITSMLKDIQDYKQRNKPTQLYVKYRKR